MRSVDRDLFRHVTGLGRGYVGFIDHVLNNWDLRPDEPLPTGNLQVRIDDDTQEFCAKFIPSPEVRPSDQITLSIFVKQADFMEVTALPLWMVLNGTKDRAGYYQLYQHQFVALRDATPIEGAIYTGVTKRGWRTRWSEHLRGANSGSHYRFHRAIRQYHGAANVMSHHLIVACGLSEQTALEMEETYVASDSLYPLGLNMVPGGNKGLAYLRSIGAIGKNERVAPDDRQAIINRFFERVSRKGLPNPMAAANWLDANYAERVMCAAEDRLKPQQIRLARFLSSMGHDAPAIAEQVGARNVSQVRRLLAGETYSRVA